MPSRSPRADVAVRSWSFLRAGLWSLKGALCPYGRFAHGRGAATSKAADGAGWSEKPGVPAGARTGASSASSYVSCRRSQHEPRDCCTAACAELTQGSCGCQVFLSEELNSAGQGQLSARVPPLLPIFLWGRSPHTTASLQQLQRGEEASLCPGSFSPPSQCLLLAAHPGPAVPQLHPWHHPHVPLTHGFGVQSPGQ